MFPQNLGLHNIHARFVDFTTQDGHDYDNDEIMMDDSGVPGGGTPDNCNTAIALKSSRHLIMPILPARVSWAV
jgi:hypothetical protein